MSSIATIQYEVVPARRPVRVARVVTPADKAQAKQFLRVTLWVLLLVSLALAALVANRKLKIATEQYDFDYSMCQLPPGIYYQAKNNDRNRHYAAIQVAPFPFPNGQMARDLYFDHLIRESRMLPFTGTARK